MRVFVINAYADRKDKYLSDSRYELYPAIWWENVSDDNLDDYYFRHNAKKEYRKKVIACSKSHKQLLLKIIIEDLKNVLIMENLS